MSGLQSALHFRRIDRRIIWVGVHAQVALERVEVVRERTVLVGGTAAGKKLGCIGAFGSRIRIARLAVGGELVNGRLFPLVYTRVCDQRVELTNDALDRRCSHCPRRSGTRLGRLRFGRSHFYITLRM